MYPLATALLQVAWKYLHLVELVQYRLCEALLAEDVRLDPPRQVGTGLVLHVRASRNSKDVVKLLQGTLLCLRHPQEAVTR
jgi:hypothetical protein